MKVITREVIDKVTFSKNEVEAFENLISAMHRCCKVFHKDCENCPFVEIVPTICEDVLDFLTGVTEMEDNKED